MGKSWLDQKWFKWAGIDWENDELIVLVLTAFVIARVLGYA